MVSASRVPRFIGVFILIGISIAIVFADAFILTLFVLRIILVTAILYPFIIIGLLGGVLWPSKFATR